MHAAALHAMRWYPADVLCCCVAQQNWVNTSPGFCSLTTANAG